MIWVALLAETAGSAGCQTRPPPVDPAGAVETARQSLATFRPGFQETAVFTGLDQPTAVRFAPDGRVFVAEKRGRVLVFDNLGDPTPSEFARLDDNVHDFWDRGLLGLALHPQFATRPYVYVLYSLDAPVGGTPPVWRDDCPDPPGATDDGCVIGARLSRLEAAGNAGGATETVLLESWGQQYPSHSIGDLAFGADGALYVSSGDGASFTFVDYGQRGQPPNPLGDPPVAVGGALRPPLAMGGALRAQSPRRPTGPVVLNGAVLRLDPLTGAELPDNPLAGQTDTNARRIVAHGLRNPFRLTTRPGTSEIWVGDVGAATWEEINRITNPADATVENFGWPCYEGRGRQPGFDGANLFLCELFYVSGGHSPPFFTYNHGDRLVAGEACGVGSSSVTGLAFYAGDKYPERYRGALFFTDYSRKCAWAMLAGADGLPDPGQIETFGSALGGPVDLQMGPDGNLYYVDLLAGEVRRVTYLLPRAVASATPTSGPPPLVVNFDGSASTAPLPGDTLTYAWDLDGDGQFDDASEARPGTVYDSAGTVTARLQVTDPRGVTAVSDPLAITVTAVAMPSTPPVPVIEAPAAGGGWKVGETITFAGRASDAEDGPLAPAALSWMLVLQHCPSGCHSHVVQTWSGVAGGSFTAPDHEYPSHLELVLTARDGSGITATSSLRLDPGTVMITLQSQPPGIPLTFGLEEASAPFGRAAIVGGHSSVAAPLVHQLGAQPWAFAAWSNGQPRFHEVGPLTSALNLTARFRPAGLTVEYFSDFALAERKAVGIDGRVSFNWGRVAPHPAVGVDFSARWSGFLEPESSGAHVFAVDSDDGARLWLDDQLIIDAWAEHAVRRDVSLPIPLTAGRRVKLRLEHRDQAADAVARLWWSGPAQLPAIVPADRLYPACLDGACPNGLACAGGTCIFQCALTCPAGQRCDSGEGGDRCVDLCQGVTCEGGKCLAGACVPRCQGVTCEPGLTCQPASGRCEDERCRAVVCPAGQTCSLGTCKPICEVTGCAAGTRCEAASGLCRPLCTGVSCEPGFACNAATGTCEDRCATLSCPGQACQAGECKPTCVVKGCPATERCNPTTGACVSRCADITCAPGAACLPATGQCSDPAGDAGADALDPGPPVDAGLPSGGDGAPPVDDAAAEAPAVTGGDGGQAGGEAGGTAADAPNVAVAASSGCDCSVGAEGGAGPSPAMAGAGLLVLAGLLARRRRRR